MRFIKFGLISIVLFALLLTAFSLLLPSQTNISRAIDINAPADSVYAYINNITKWQNWYANYDSSNTSYSLTTVGKGSSLTMDKTTITIQEALPGKIKAVWQTGSNNPIMGEFNFIRKDSSSSMTLQWNFIQKVKWYPWQKLASILSNKTIGPFMEKSLENLKKKVESQEEL
ncbi:SRPBCC family protein [Segetibacter koreensis]|uniref:SRPBCC family protein n=1 Tax=Segetibacter koreensis TaxID=398037 RepID=UPI00035C3571|nr:SRPBCC family protein [Segetibacter koreensis]